MEQVRLLSMTAMLTLLVWVSADSLVNESATLPTVFKLVPPGSDPDMRVKVASNAPAFEIQVTGPRKTIAALRAEAPLTIALTAPVRPTGEASILVDRRDVREFLVAKSSEFRKLSVTAIIPERVVGEFDHFVTRDAAIVMKNLTRAYEVEPQVSPSRVTVRLRETRLDEFNSGEALQIDISADVERLLGERSGGESTTITVSLDSSRFGPEASISPGSVDVTATLQAQRTTVRISTVPILFAVSFANLERAVRPVGRDGSPMPLVTRSITVSGRSEQIRRLLQGDTRAFGIIQLKQDDLDRLNELKLVTPEYRLPDGVSLADTPAPIEFKLVPVGPEGPSE